MATGDWREQRRILLTYGAAIGGLIAGAALAIWWGAKHPLHAYHCHPWSSLWIALLAFMLFGPLWLGRTSSPNLHLRLLAAATIAAFLCFFSVNWQAIETCAPL